MGMHSLPPGFRFHPTDVELVMYFLKRKVLGKKLSCEVISELDIYKFTPWDLPGKSCLRTGDLKWYFFCPREKKFSCGPRMSRSTDIGSWKSTGRDRKVHYKERIVGMIKTLIFHIHRAGKRDRTDWVMHEYRLEDNELADTGIELDSYVLCEVFQKSGRGPRNGAQYGAPFNEQDWDDDLEAQCAGPFCSLPDSQINPIVSCRCNPCSVCTEISTEMGQSLTQQVDLTISEEHNRHNPIVISGRSPGRGCSGLPFGTGRPQAREVDLLEPEEEHHQNNPSITITNGCRPGSACAGSASELYLSQAGEVELLDAEDGHHGNAIARTRSVAGSLYTELSSEPGPPQAREVDLLDPEDDEILLMLADFAEDDILLPNWEGSSENMLFGEDGDFLELQDLDCSWGFNSLS